MKKPLYILLFSCLCISLRAQVPYSFTWESRHVNTSQKYSYDYISKAKNQQMQGPCGVFATIAAVEAMSQIYYNNGQKDVFDFSEAYVYNDNSKPRCPGIGCDIASAENVLNFAKTTGLIDDDCFVFPEGQDSCIIDCSESKYCGNPDQRVQIPNVESFQISLSTNSALKQAILDYGPIIMMPGSPNGCALHQSDPDCTNRKHTVLFIGWSGSLWHIKDSWPNSASIEYKSYSVFDYQPSFYRVYPVHPQNSYDTIRCSGSQYELFSRKAVDKDGDGFYNWGLDSYSKPSSCTGPDKMDYDDGDRDFIFRDGSTILPTPTISGPSGPVCPSGGTFTLNDVPTGFGFSTSWIISKNAYCFDTYYGNSNPATVYPNSLCVGKKCDITFEISHNGSAYYTKSFYVNGPPEDLVSISVYDSYGGSPPKYGDTYYLCPYTTYYIYYNNYDYNCTTSDFDWVLPYSWTEYYHNSNYIIINTNDWPDGFLEIWAKTSCCSPNERVKVFTQYFGAAECGGYFMAFPNPSSDFVDIDVIKEKLASEKISIDSECLLTIVDKSGMIKYKTEFKGFPYRLDTSKLPEGIYFVNLLYKGKTSTIRLIIEH